MNKLKDIIGRGSCALCGKGVYLNDADGRIACTGCKLATEECSCTTEGQP